MVHYGDQSVVGSDIDSVSHHNVGETMESSPPTVRIMQSECTDSGEESDSGQNHEDETSDRDSENKSIASSTGCRYDSTRRHIDNWKT
jgi:hypothetical protein